MNYEIHEDYVNDVKASVLKVARDMIQEKIDLFEGCRQLVGFQYELENERETFLPIIAINSETDRFPIESARDGWLPEALLELDKERDEYLAQVKDRIFETCRDIIAKLS